MELKDIEELPVPSDENCVLFLWATAPKLTEALDVMRNWGFTYRTCMVWDKEEIGMGYWFRNQHELLLVGIKGNISPPEPTKRVSSVFRKKSKGHSVKPYKIRDLVKEWYPAYEKIELFSRENHEGWDSWGNDETLTKQSLLNSRG